MKEMLGEEPWDLNKVESLYLANFSSMYEIIRSHSGYSAYLNIIKIKNLFLKLRITKEKIVLTQKDCSSKYFNDCRDSNSSRALLEDTQANIGLFFYAYVSLCYSIIELEKKFLNTNFIKNQNKAKDLFLTTLDNPCHRCIIFIRNRLNHGVTIDFRWNASISFEEQKRTISFKITQNELKKLAFSLKGEKDNQAYAYLQKKDGDLIAILLEHFKMISSFCNKLCDIMYEENENEILLCNSYCNEICIRADIQGRAIAKSIGKEWTHPQNNEHALTPLERIMGYSSL